MAAGDAVLMRFSNSLPGDVSFGVVDSEAGTDATVLWRKTGLLTTVPQARLFKAFTAPDAVKQVGQWAQLLGFPELEADGGEVAGFPPKTRAAGGPIIEAFGVADYDAQAPNNEWVVGATEDGRGRMLLEYSSPADLLEGEAAYITKPGRRNV